MLLFTLFVISVCAFTPVHGARPDLSRSPEPRAESPIVLPPSYEVCSSIGSCKRFPLSRVHKSEVAKRSATLLLTSS
jgi:hypothetical protein